MPTYTADKLAQHLRERGAEVQLTPSPEGAVHEVVATYGDTTVSALFLGRTGRFAFGLVQTSRGQADVQLSSLKAVVDALGLDAIEDIEDAA